MILRVNPQRGVRTRRLHGENLSESALQQRDAVSYLAFEPAALTMRDMGRWKMYDVEAATFGDHHVLRTTCLYDDHSFEQLFFLERRCKSKGAQGIVEVWNLQVQRTIEK